MSIIEVLLWEADSTRSKISALYPRNNYHNHWRDRKYSSTEVFFKSIDTYAKKYLYLWANNFYINNCFLTQICQMYPHYKYM